MGFAPLGLHSSTSILRVTSWLPRFDDWLNRLLEECARDAGEDVEAYVARAVAAQMVVDQRQGDGASVEELLTRLSRSEVFGDSSMPSVVAAITDPERLRALYATGLLDSPPEEVYDRITRAAAAALDAPFAAVSLIDSDRQFFKSTVGMNPGLRETPLDRSVCQYAVADGASLVLDDMRNDPVFKNHPVVRDGSVAAYLGIPLNDHEGHTVGTLCVFDDKPRFWGAGHVQVLTDLAKLTAERMFGAGSGPSS